MRSWLRNSRRESLLIALVAYVLLDILAHWHPALRSTFEFLPREEGGDVNEFVTLWVDEFSRNVRELGFTKTLYFLNPWSNGTFYTSHPGFLTFVTALWQSLFGDGPDTLRGLAILFFSIRLGLLHSLVSSSYGQFAARASVILYLLVPATQTYTHALSFEVVSGTLVLAAFWARRWWAGAVLFALAALTDYTALFALPVFLYFSPHRLWSGWIAVVPAVLQILWAKLAAGAGEESQLSRAWMYLIGPFYVLGNNTEARDQLFLALRMSFPFLYVVLFSYDLFRFGVRARPAWWYGCLSGGALFLVCFLGVFRVHPYCSQLLILPLCASTARSLQLFWLERRLTFALTVFAVAVLSVIRFSYPFQNREQAERRLAFRTEAEKISPLLKDKSFQLFGGSWTLRPEPVPRYLLPARQQLVDCAELSLSYTFGEPAENTGQVFRGSFLVLDENICPKSRPHLNQAH